MNKMISGVATVAVGLAMTASSAYAECGEIQIAEMNWASAELMANVDAVILEKGYGCTVELVPGATMTTFASMENKGQPDVAPELWINAVREPLFKAFEAGTMISTLEGPITGAGEGWFTTESFKKNHPELDTVLKAIERPDLFPHPEDPSKGGLVGCPSGWGCQLITNNLYRAFDMKAKGWEVVDPGSAAGLDGSIAKAASRDENWLGYYWSPTAIVGKYNLQKLDFGVPYAGDENWDGCLAKPEEECDDPKPSSWKPVEIHTVITSGMKDKADEATLAYFSARAFPGEVMNAMLVYMDSEQASGADAAIEFLMKHPDVWKPWVSEDAAKKIEASL